TTPGIYKRGSRYVFAYRVDRRQRWESARTLDEARTLKSERITDANRGELEERSTLTLHAYASGWIERYHGTGRRGFREETRAEYRAMLDKYALRYFAKGTLYGRSDLSRWPSSSHGCASSRTAARAASSPTSPCATRSGR